MSPTIAPPPPGKKGSRRALPWLSDRPDTRAIQIGVLGTILIHLLLLLVAPRLLRVDASHDAPRQPAAPKQFNIEIAPNAFTPPKPPQKAPPKFVEANPNAPENIPDKTNNISDRNQQVAQEKPTPNGKNDMPALEGRKDVASTQIVDGRLTKPQEAAPAPPPVETPPQPVSAAVPKAEQNPLAGFEKAQGDSKDGFASHVAKEAPNTRDIPKKIDGAKNAPLVENATSATPQIDPRHPQPRATLEQHVRPAIFSENKVGTSNIGPTAVDARWSNYGVYLQRMIETVQIEWERILSSSRIYPSSGTLVAVKFVMNSKGQIARIVSVDPSAGAGDAATRACVTGITARSPYGDWTDDMVAVLGTEQEMTFTFYYQ